MNKKLVVASLTLSAVAVLGLGAWLVFEDMRGPPRPSPMTEERREARKVDFRDVPSAGMAPSEFAALTPEQQQAVRASLEKLFSETSAQKGDAGSAPVGPQEYANCVSQMAESLQGDSGGKVEAICNCVSQTLQKLYPAGRPTGSVHGSQKRFTRAYRAALARCVGEGD